MASSSAPTPKIRQTIVKKNVLNFFLELETTVQLYHWMTTKYSRHKGSDFLFEKTLESVDKFVETYLGRYGRPKDFNESITVKRLSDSEFVSYLKKIAIFLESKFATEFNISQTDTDLLNIRDELLGHINQTLYLFTLE